MKASWTTLLSRALSVFFSHCELSSAAVAVSGKRRSVHPAPAQEPGQPRDKIQLGFWQRAGKTWEKTGSRSPLTPPLDPWERNDTQFQLWDLKKFARTSFCAKNKRDLYVNPQFQHFRGNCWKSGKNTLEKMGRGTPNLVGPLLGVRSAMTHCDHDNVEFGCFNVLE